MGVVVGPGVDCEGTPQIAQLDQQNQSTIGPSMGFVGNTLVFTEWVSGQDDLRLVDETGAPIFEDDARNVQIMGGGAGTIIGTTGSSDRWAPFIGTVETGRLLDGRLSSPSQLGRWFSGPFFGVWQEGQRQVWRWDTELGTRQLSGDGTQLLDAESYGTLTYDADEKALVFFGEFDGQLFIPIDLPPLYGAFHRRAVYWIDIEGFLWRVQLDSGRLDQLAEACTQLVTDGDLMVASCATDSAVRPGSALALVMESSEAPADGSDLVLTTLALDAAYVAAVATNGKFVAWAAYDDPDAWCQDFDTLGRLMVLTRLDGSLSPTQVDALGVGCICCGAFWPEMWLQFSGDWLGWNYAIDPEVMNERRDIKAAKVEICR